MASGPKVTTGRVFDLDSGIKRNRKKTLGKENEEERPIVQTLFIIASLLKYSKFVKIKYPNNSKFK